MRLSILLDLKYILLFTFLIPILSFETLAQSIYYDALKLKNMHFDMITESGQVQLKSETEAYSILGKYIDKDNPSITDINNIFNKRNDGKDLNPFIDISTTTLSGSIAGVGKKILSGVGGLNVTTFADGYAQFLIERAQEELNIAFFQKFKNYLTNHQEIRVLFPETSDFLTNISPYEYTLFINNLKEVFLEDIRKAIPHLSEVFLLPKYEKVVIDFPEILVFTQFLQITEDLEESKHPSEILKNLKEIKEWEKITRTESKNVFNLIKSANLLSDAFRNISDTSVVLFDNEEYNLRQEPWGLLKNTKDGTDTLQVWQRRAWITPRHLEILVKEEVFFKIFLGLLYQQSVKDSIKFITKNGKEIAFSDFLGSNRDQLYVFRSLFIEFIKIANNVEESIVEIKEKRKHNETLEPDDFYKYINSSIDILEYGFSVANYVSKDSLSVGKHIQIIKDCNNLYKNVYEKKYLAAITNTLLIIENISSSITTKDFDYRDSRHLKEEITRLSGGSSAINVQLNGSYKEAYSAFANLAGVSKGALKYGMAAAIIVDAKSANEVKEAIETVALPVGGSSIKKYKPINIALNGYIGGFIAHENVYNFQTPNGKKFFNSIGFYAPLGITVSKSLCKGKGGAISLFGQIIDIGTVTSLRLQNGVEKELPKLTVANIISPGLYTIWGIPKSPFSIGVGFQMGPNLREIKDIDSEVRANRTFSLFAAFDIPIINIYSK